MSADDLKKVMKFFPESFYLHVLSLSNKWVAASISIRVEHNILYTFYYDHDAEYDRLSPVVMLMDGIYSFCQQEGIKLLDLGTSNINGKLSESLLDFKLSLGAEPSRKLTFVKHFS
jgi:CelD/BcsL family acetyltransferase involved in cellulose biosynthesis